MLTNTPKAGSHREPASLLRRATPARLARIGLLAALALGLAACGTAPATPPAPAPAAQQAATIEIAIKPVPAQPPQLTVTPVQAPPVESPVVLDAEAAPVPDVITALLTYAERVRALNAADLAAEIVVQGDPGNAPLRQMQLALAVMHLHQPADTARALGLVQRVINHPGPESVQLKPLARLLAARLMDQRRLEDAMERQAQQLRESQRRIEQLNERLEAMRAIERSINSRPSAAPAPTPPASAPGANRPAP